MASGCILCVMVWRVWFWMINVIPGALARMYYTVTLDSMKSVGFVLFCIITNPTKQHRKPRVIRIYCHTKTIHF